MRILVAHSFYRVTGGEDHYVRNQVDLLAAHHKVELLAAHNTNLSDGLGLAARMAWSPGTTRAVERRIVEVRPEVIHLHNAYPSLGPAVHLAARRQRVPLVMTVHNLRLRCPNGVMFTGGAPCRRCEGGAYVNAVLHHCLPTARQAVAYAGGLWLHRFVVPLEAMVSLFVAPSQFTRNMLVSWGIEAERVVTVRNFTAVAPNAKTDPGRYGIYLGRLSAEKGLPDLFRALKLADDPPFRVIGTGPLAAELRSLVEALDLRRTRLLGQLGRDRVQEEVRGARYLVMPSRCDDNSPLAALEALGEGRPLLVTDVGGLPELVANGAGLVCQPGDVTAMAAHLRRLAEDDELCLAAGRRGLDFAQRELRPQVHRRSLELAYTRAAGDGWGRRWSRA